MNQRARPGAGFHRGIVRRGIAGLLLWGLIGAGQGTAESFFVDGFESARAVSRGGSTLNWYRLGPGCEREPYGIIANYHEPGVRAQVVEQLVELRAAGQERLAVSLYHMRPASPSDDGRVTGTVLDSTGGQLHPQMQQNLVDYLADIRAAGFGELLFRYHPQGPNDVRNGQGWNSSLRDENWALIAGIEPLLLESGLLHRTDLLAEGMPRARNVGSVIFDNVAQFSDWSDYARFIWRAYADAFGTARTVGFSFVSDTDGTRIDARAKHMGYIYGSQRPGVLGLSLYGTPTRDEAWIFREYRRQLVDEGWRDPGWIIAETWYNDPAAAEAIVAAMNSTRQRVWYLLQWPVERGNACSPDVSVATPAGFEAFSTRGF